MSIQLHNRPVLFRSDDANVVGERCFYTHDIVFLCGDKIEMGHFVGFGQGCYVNGYGGLTIGDDTRFGPGVMIHTANHVRDDGNWHEWADRPVTIGERCWIGMGVIICPGAIIGDDVIVGAGSVLPRGEYPEGTYVGNPARRIA